MTRTHDDGRNERQRKRDEDARARKERGHDDGRSARQRIEEEKNNPDFAEHMAEERKRPDFIERTRPDDPSDRFGQLTRDNVNPDIPSAPPGEGEIVDPNTLGMPQGGRAPEAPAAEAEAPPQPLVDEGVPSINEPPGSQVQPPPEPPPDGPQQLPQAAPGRAQAQGRTSEGGGRADAPAGHPAAPEPLPSETELNAMTRAELDEIAEQRGLDPDTCGTKAEVIALLRKDARKR
jgi:hypothetical protein